MNSQPLVWVLPDWPAYISTHLAIDLPPTSSYPAFLQKIDIMHFFLSKLSDVSEQTALTVNGVSCNALSFSGLPAEIRCMVYKTLLPFQLYTDDVHVERSNGGDMSIEINESLSEQHPLRARQLLEYGVQYHGKNGVPQPALIQDIVQVDDSWWRRDRRSRTSIKVSGFNDNNTSRRLRALSQTCQLLRSDIMPLLTRNLCLAIDDFSTACCFGAGNFSFTQGIHHLILDNHVRGTTAQVTERWLVQLHRWIPNLRLFQLWDINHFRQNILSGPGGFTQQDLQLMRLVLSLWGMDTVERRVDDYAVIFSCEDRPWMQPINLAIEAGSTEAVDIEAEEIQLHDHRVFADLMAWGHTGKGDSGRSASLLDP